uniref:Uncharacterized protein LOC114346827 isoform X1 n=1 Tax=Diabrotica virgifera virgifera TaxID=50390 RepID=A0A6P7H4A5_DIAVI
MVNTVTMYFILINILFHLKKPRSSFNGIGYLSESFYNANSKYPHRKNPCLHIFEMDWVNLELKKRSRPFYPLSYLMTRDTAVRYIQAYLRGLWVRKRPELNEIRTFWKTIHFKRGISVPVDNETPLLCSTNGDIGTLLIF